MVEYQVEKAIKGKIYYKYEFDNCTLTLLVCALWNDVLLFKITIDLSSDKKVLVALAQT